MSDLRLIARQAAEQLHTIGDTLDDFGAGGIKPDRQSLAAELVQSAEHLTKFWRLTSSPLPGPEKGIEPDRLKAQLAGWNECLRGLRLLAERGRVKPEGFDPVLTEIQGMIGEIDMIESRL